MPKPRGKRAHSPEPQAVIGRSQLAYLNQLVKSSLNDSGPRTVTAASNGGSLGVAEVDDAPQILKREAKRLKSEAKGPIKVSWVMNAIPCGEDDSSHIEDVCEQPDSPANNGQRSRDKMASASSRGKEARNEKNKKKKQRGSFGGSSFSSSFTPSTSKQLHSRSAAQSDHESQDESEADYVTSEFGDPGAVAASANSSNTGARDAPMSSRSGDTPPSESEDDPEAQNDFDFDHNCEDM